MFPIVEIELIEVILNLGSRISRPTLHSKALLCSDSASNLFRFLPSHLVIESISLQPINLQVDSEEICQRRESQYEGPKPPLTIRSALTG